MIKNEYVFTIMVCSTETVSRRIFRLHSRDQVTRQITKRRRWAMMIYRFKIE